MDAASANGGVSTRDFYGVIMLWYATECCGVPQHYDAISLSILDPSPVHSRDICVRFAAASGLLNQAYLIRPT